MRLKYYSNYQTTTRKQKTNASTSTGTRKSKNFRLGH